MWVNATRSDANKFYDMGFGDEKKETDAEAIQRQLAHHVQQQLIRIRTGNTGD